MNAKIKDKASSYPGCDSFRYRQKRETLRPHIIPVLPPQAAVTSTYLRESILSFYLLLTSVQSTLKQSSFARPQPLVLLWLLASPGLRGSVIFAPSWGQVTKPLFFKLHDR